MGDTKLLFDASVDPTNINGVEENKKTLQHARQPPVEISE